MNKHNSSRAKMVRTVTSFCNDNTSITSAIVAFAPALKTVETKLALVDQLDKIAGSPTTGVTTDTNAIRKIMETLAFKITSAVSAYASTINNNELFGKTNYTERELQKFKKDETDDKCETIYDLGTKHSANAQKYGFVAADLTDLKTIIDLYRTAMQNPTKAIINRSQANNQIDSILSEIIATNLKKQLDKMVNTLKSTNAVFVDGYFQARNIIEIGSRSSDDDEPPPITPM